LHNEEKEPGELIDFQFHPKQKHLLLALYSSNLLILWNIKSNSPVWRKELSEPLQMVIFNPFNPHILCFASKKGEIYISKDFSEEYPPKNIEGKYEFSSNEQTSEFVAMEYSPNNKDIIYFVLSRKICVYDLTTEQEIGSCLLERNRASFKKVIICREADSLYCLHEDGSITLWITKDKPFSYKSIDMIDLVRLVKQTRKKENKICFFYAKSIG